MATWTSNSYNGRYLQLTITETANPADNSSTLNWTLTSTGGSATYYTIDTTTVTINGVQVYYKARTNWDDRVFPAATGSVNGSLTVYHDSDGKKTVTVGFSTRVYIYGPEEYGGGMVLTNLDRTAPTISLSVSSVTANSLYISSSATATCDVWQYSLNGGSTWNTLSSATSSSAYLTVSGLSPNTNYSVRVRGRKQANQVYGYSSTLSVTTLGGAVINKVNDVTADAATVSIVLNTTVYEASYTNTLAIKNGSTTYLTISGLSWSKGTANRTVTLTAAQRTTLLNAMATIKSFNATFSVSTYSGSTQIGSSSTYTAKVTTTAANSGPTMGSFTFEDSYATTTAITGNNQLFIQGHSTLKVTPGTATAKNGATITNFTATCSGVSASNTTGAAITVGKVSKSGTVAVVLTVTDSRGYTVSQSRDITVIPYAKPKVNEISIHRTNDIEDEMRLSFSGYISAISVGGVQKNSLLYVRYQYKLTSASTYGSFVNILSTVSATGTSFSFSNPELCNLDSNASFDFHLQIRDKLNSLSSVDLYFVIPQGTPLVALRKSKVGINTPTPEAALHVVGDAKVSGTITATTLNGTISPTKLSSAVPITKGGTGATTAAAARTNLGVLPLAGGTMTGQISRGSTAASWIGGRNTAAIRTTVNSSSGSFYPVVSAKSVNGSWEIGTLGDSLYFSYATDTNYNAGTNTTIHPSIDTSGNFSGKATNVTGIIAIANGGTGSTNAAGARANLGIACTSLYNGTLTTGSTTFNYGSYKAYIIVGQPTSTAGRCALVIPAAVLTTTATAFQIADEGNFYSFYLSYSGSTVTLTYKSKSSSGQILRIFGVN